MFVKQLITACYGEAISNILYTRCVLSIVCKGVKNSRSTVKHIGDILHPINLSIFYFDMGPSFCFLESRIENGEALFLISATSNLNIIRK